MSTIRTSSLIGSLLLALLLLMLGAFTLVSVGGLVGAATDYSVPLTASSLLSAASHPSIGRLLSCFPLWPTALSVLSAVVVIAAQSPRFHRRRIGLLVVVSALLFVSGGWVGAFMLASDLSGFMWQAEWLGEAWPLFEFMFIASVGIAIISIALVVGSRRGLRANNALQRTRYARR